MYKAGTLHEDGRQKGGGEWKVEKKRIEDIGKNNKVQCRIINQPHPQCSDL